MSMTVSNIQSVLVPVFNEYGVRRGVLFGSYAQGHANEQSDVDLLVDSGLKGFAFTCLVEDVHEKLNKPVDILDVTHIIKGSPIEREVQRTGVTIYEK
jgi:predicted nucleotidyltransferase